MKGFLHRKGKEGVNGALSVLSFCCNCLNPEIEGSHIDALLAARGPQEFHVSSGIVYAVPNNGSSSKFINDKEMRGMITIMFRGGGVSLADKVFAAQMSGALGVIFIDNGSCDENFKSCGLKNGFGAQDEWYLWEMVNIPCILVTKEGGVRLNDLLKPDTIFIPNIGYQRIIHDDSHVKIIDEL